MRFHHKLLSSLFPESAVKITHVKQCHIFPDATNRQKEEEIAPSQFLVAKTIMKNKDSIVVDEGINEDHTPEHYQQTKSNALSFYHVVRHLFPRGMPDNYSELTAVQKIFLAENGASILLFYFGKISHIYKAHSEIESKENDELYRTGKDIIFFPREKQAIYWSKKASIQGNNKKILLVYGAAHDFEEAIEKANIPGVIFDTSINAITNLQVMPTLENTSLPSISQMR